jgi:hypothetical protein
VRATTEVVNSNQGRLSVSSRQQPSRTLSIQASVRSEAAADSGSHMHSLPSVREGIITASSHQDGPTGPQSNQWQQPSRLYMAGQHIPSLTQGINIGGSEHEPGLGTGGTAGPGSRSGSARLSPTRSTLLPPLSWQARVATRLARPLQGIVSMWQPRSQAHTGPSPGGTQQRVPSARVPSSSSPAAPSTGSPQVAVELVPSSLQDAGGAIHSPELWSMQHSSPFTQVPPKVSPRNSRPSAGGPQEGPSSSAAAGYGRQRSSLYGDSVSTGAAPGLYPSQPDTALASMEEGFELPARSITITHSVPQPSIISASGTVREWVPARDSPTRTHSLLPQHSIVSLHDRAQGLSRRARGRAGSGSSLLSGCLSCLRMVTAGVDEEEEDEEELLWGGGPARRQGSRNIKVCMWPHSISWLVSCCNRCM